MIGLRTLILRSSGMLPASQLNNARKHQRLCQLHVHSCCASGVQRLPVR
jgi:hypothetical protein